MIPRLILGLLWVIRRRLADSATSGPALCHFLTSYMVDCSACKHPERLRQSFNDQHGAGGEVDEPVGGFA